MPGTWKSLPTNCTKNLALRWVRCAEYGQIIFESCAKWATQTQQKCAKWEDDGHSACSKWSDHGHNECCDWAPCSWFCHAFYWVANVLCDAWYWVANLVCVLFTLVAVLVCTLFAILVVLFCALWEFFTIFVCTSSANGGTMLLLTDGTILMQECLLGYGTRRWWKLIPDRNGSYFNGNWKRLSDSHVARKYFASAVLADGRVLVFGGEYSDSSGTTANDETNRCEIYDPVADSWTEINPPANTDGSSWEEIGDAACVLLANGTFLMGNSSDRQTAIFDPAANTWSLTGNKNNRSSEESWALLPDGTVITANCFGHPASEKFVPANNGWSVDANIPAGSDIVEDASKETGPAVLLTNGNVFCVGSTGSTALYTPGTVTGPGSWAAGPTLPMAGNQQQGTKDGPGCLLVNGNVLFGIAPINNQAGDYLKPTTFFEFDGANVNRTSDPPNSDHETYVGRMLLMPTGDVMFAREDDSHFYAYTKYGSLNEKLRPVISNCPTVLAPGGTIAVSGLLFNGFSQAVGYGDDSTAATNYPLVRIKNRRNGHMRYCRTFNHTTVDAAGNTVTAMGVATGDSTINTNVELPADLETGSADLFVIANGIESAPFEVSVVVRKG